MAAFLECLCAWQFELLLPGIHHVVHRFGLKFGDALQLCASGINDLLWPSQRRGGRGHFFDN